MKKYGSYQSYKDSESVVLGEIPAHWNSTRLKNLIYKITSGVTPKGGAESYVEIGIPFLRSQNVHNGGLRLEDVSFISETTHREMVNSQIKAGDILFNITGASIARSCVVPNSIKTANISQHIALLRPRKRYLTEYIAYFLQSQFVKDYVYLTQSGASKEAFNHSQIKSIPIAIPSSFSDQLAITNFIDTQVSVIDRKIDLLIQKSNQYEKLKQSLINETVTRGLDKAISLKETDIEWMGKVPAHWEVKRIKEIFVESKSVSTSGDEVLLSVSEYTGVTQKRDNIEKNELLTNAATLVGYKICHIGDLVINIMLAWKRGLGVSPFYGIVSPSYAVFKPKKQIDSKYFHYRLRNDDAIAEFKRSSTGIIESRLRLYPDSFYALSLAVPPIEEQTKIAAYLDDKTTKIDQIVNTVNQQVENLKELRKTLINDVVTGKIKVTQDDNNKGLAA